MLGFFVSGVFVSIATALIGPLPLAPQGPCVSYLIGSGSSVICQEEVRNSVSTQDSEYAPALGSDVGGDVPVREPVCVPAVMDGVPALKCRYPLGLAAEAPEVTDLPFDLPGTAAQAAASLTVPAPVMHVGPDPANNKWNALAIGLPVWVWAEKQEPLSTSVSEQGIQIDMTATRGPVTIDWGDGTVIVCRTMTPRSPTHHPMTKSPDCGHVYQKPGDYTITMTADWTVNWAALGMNGEAGLQAPPVGYDLRISEFTTVVVG